MSQPITLSPRREFDQVVKGNVNIKQLGQNKYKITFNKISKFLKYQTWSKNILNNENSVSKLHHSANKNKRKNHICCT
jgi:hypothetical protein